MQRKARQLHEKCPDLAGKRVLRVGEGRRNQNAIVPQHPANFGESLLRLRHDMQGIGHNDHVKTFIGIGKAKHILHREMQLGRMIISLRFRDHLRRCIRSLDMGSAAHDIFGDQTCTGCQLQHRFVPYHRAQQLVQPLVSRCVLAHEAVVPPGVFIPEILTVSHDFALTTRY